MNRKIILTFVLSFFVFVSGTTPVLAQSATESATATNSATATESATATSSGTTVASTSGTTTLPQTGAHDVLILLSAGVIFLAAGVTALTGTRKVFIDAE